MTNPGTSDPALTPVSQSQLQKDAAGDDGARLADPDLWLEEHGNVMYKFAYLRVRDAHVAEDLVQETFLNAIAGFAKFRSESTIRTWLFTILRNEISRHFRSKKSHDRVVDEQNELQSVFLGRLLHPRISGPQFSNAIEREEFWDVVQQCYEELPEHLLDTFLYRLANPDAKIDTLCRELDIKQSNVSVRLFRARLMLRHCIEKKWTSEG